MNTGHTRGRPELPAPPPGPGSGSMNAARQQPRSQHPTLRAGQGPPEDDEYEYSEYSVEEYQDPEVPRDGDGENRG